MRKSGVWNIHRRLWMMGVAASTVFFMWAVGGILLLEASGSEIRQRAELELTLTGAISPLAGDAELRLRIREDGEVRFRARATAEGEGLVEGDFFSLCVDDLFIDAAVAEELVEEEGSGGNSVVEAVEVVVDLRGDLEEAPFTSLVGLMVKIREGVGCDGTVVLSGTVDMVES